MSEWWTLAQVLRWIRTRDREAVAGVEDDHQYAPDMATGMEAAALADHLGEGPDDPEDGELRNESPDALIREHWHPTDRQHPILRTLTTAAAEGRVEVLGRREGEGRPEPIPDCELTALALDLIEGAAWTTADNLNEGVQPSVAWRDTRWQADGVRKLWPPKPKPPAPRVTHRWGVWEKIANDLLDEHGTPDPSDPDLPSQAALIRLTNDEYTKQTGNDAPSERLTKARARDLMAARSEGQATPM